MAAPASQSIGTKYGVKGNMWAAGHHTGVDFLTPTGTTLKAPVDSKIIHAGTGGWGAAYGIHVIGECKVGGKTYRWITAHMSKVSVKAGQQVKLGATLGKSGATGNVTGPHCHFEVRVSNYAYGKDVNPSVLINVKASETYKFTKRVDTYVVTTKAVPLNGRSGPGTSYAVKSSLPKGGTFVSAGYTTIDGALWIQRASDSAWFAGEYLDLVVAKPEPEQPEQPPVVCEVDPPTKPTDPPPPPPPHKDTVTIPLMLMPLAGYNKTTAEGVTNWERNTLGAISQVTRHKPSILGVTELSDKKVAKMKPLFIQRATAYTTHGGSDGRYAFTRDKYTTEHIAHGAWTAPAKLNGDGKQMGWTADVVHGVRIAVGVAHAENENGRDTKTGKDANVIKVEQALQFADHLLAMAERYDCKPLLMGDFNRSTTVRDALAKRGWKACPKPGKATGWDHSGGSVTDWIFVREGTLTSEVHDNEFSDHTIVTAAWTLEV